MKMNQDQALHWLRAQELSCVGDQSKEHERTLWTYLIRDVMKDGLDQVESDAKDWIRAKMIQYPNLNLLIDGDTPFSLSVTVYQRFIEALTDNDLIWPFIAKDLKRELGDKDTGAMDLTQKLFHASFLDHLDAVKSGEAEMLDYADLKETIRENMERIEREYGKLIRAAQLKQPKETE